MANLPDYTVKISQLPKRNPPTTSDKVPLVSGNETDYSLISDLISLFFSNVPTGTIPGSVFDYVISGGVWTGDSYAVNRNASMSALSIYINARTIAISAVVARTFTASKDTYVDVLDNLDGTGTLVYTEVTNNAASPALAANSLRLAIVVTSATTIAAAASINQGQEDRVLPIASSIAYSVTDSLGNLICPRDPNRKLLGYRQIIGDFAAGTNAITDVTGLSAPVIVPTSRKIKIVAHAGVSESGTARTTYLYAREGSTKLDTCYLYGQGAGVVDTGEAIAHPASVSAGLHTYVASIECDAGANVSVHATSTVPAFIRVELE